MESEKTVEKTVNPRLSAAARVMGRMSGGAAKGGRTTASRMTAEERRARASKAGFAGAKSRWGKKGAPSDSGGKVGG